MDKEPIVIDASNLILGRMASHVAKKALEGEHVIVVNAEKAVIAGRRKRILERVKTRLRTRTLGSLEKGPTHPRRSDTLMRRVIRGMLPWKKPHGKDAYRRVKVYIGTPGELIGKTPMRLPEAEVSKLRGPYVSVEEIVKEIGALYKA